MNIKIAKNNHKNKTMKQMQWSIHRRIYTYDTIFYKNWNTQLASSDWKIRGNE